MKSKRRVVPGQGARRSPTVRTIKPAIRSPQPASPSTPAGPGAPASRPQPGVADGRLGAQAPALAPSFATDALGGRPIALEVDLGRDLVLSTPVIAAAGVFGYGVELADAVDLARLGGIVTRGTTLKPRAGNAGPRTADVAAGMLVGIGLQNPGLEAVLDRYAPAWARWRTPVIVNLCGESAGDLAEMARRLEGVPGIAGIELNLSCQNGGRNAFGLDDGAAGSLVAAVRRATDLPLLAKLTAAASDVRAVARACEDAGADALSAVNTVPGLALAADRGGPALGSGYGGLCGPALKPVALRVVWEVSQAVDLPVVGIGGVTTLDDVLDYMAAGAVAVGVGVAALADPMLPVRLGDELADACRERGVASAADLVGTALPGRLAPPSTRGAEYAR